MAARGARITKQRISLMQETALGTASVGTVKHLTGLEGVTFSPTQKTYDDASQANDRNYQLAPWLGEKSNTLGFKLPLHKLLVPNAGDLFQAALGGKRASTDLTGTGTFTTTSFAFSGGTPHDWVVFVNAAGRLIYRPVVRHAAGVATLGFALPTGYVPTSAKNPSQFGALTGASYFEDPNAQFLSLQAEIDRPGEPDKVDFILKGMVPNLLRMSLQQGQRRMVEVGLQGTDWTQSTGANIADAAKPVKQSQPWQTDCYILSDFAAPGADPAKTQILSYSVNLAPGWLALPSSIGRAGANEDTLPANPTVEWRRDKSLTEGTIEIVTAFAATTWETSRAAETDFDIALIDYLGNPAGAFAGDAFCQFFPKARLKEVSTVQNNGIDCSRLLFHLRDERDVGTSAGQMSSGLIRKHDFASFIA